MALRIAIAGLGRRGRDWITEVHDHPHWSLTAGYEIDPAARARATPAMRGRPIYARIDDVPPVDAAIIATPPEDHLVTAASFLDRATPLLVEKPLSTSLRSATDIVARARAASVPLIVGQNHRYLRSHRTVRRLIAQGAIGEPRLTSTHYYRVPHAMSPSLARSEHRIMWGMGVHHLDALRWTLQREISGVFARSFDADPSTPPGGASLDVMLDFERGARGVYTATYESRGHEFFEGGQEFYERIVGSEATLHVFQRWLFLMPRGRAPRLVRRGARTRSEEAVLLEQLSAGIREDRPSECSGEDNLNTMKAVEACLISARERRWVATSELGGPIDGP